MDRLLARLRLTVIVLLATISVGAVSQDSAPNGCGSGWNEHLVPDYVYGLGCDLHAACNKHDQCYSACEGLTPTLGAKVCEYRLCIEGGELYGKSDCKSFKFKKLLAQADARKSDCDASFYDNMISDNSTKNVCKVIAIGYKFAVVAWGKSEFIGAFASSHMPKSLARESEAAFKEFVTHASEGELSEFYLAMQRPDKPVDLTKPIGYDTKIRRLYNTHQAPQK